MTIEEVVEEKKLTVEDYALKYGMPKFLFHVTTAYNILRHNGVEIGKKTSWVRTSLALGPKLG